MNRRIAISALILAAATSVAAQPARKFDVVSVRLAGPYTGGMAGGAIVEGRRLLASHVGLTDLIGFAWDVQDFQITGGPAWKDGGMLDGPNRFTVEAKVDGGEIPTKDEMRLLMREVLADRFKLKVSIVKKSFPAWDLVIDRGGLKMKPSAPDAAFVLKLGGSGRMTLEAAAVTIERLVSTGWPRGFSGRPVADKTELTAKYDFQLQWTTNIDAANTEIPDFPSALRDQLGLRLQSSMMPLNSLTIEHAERPSEN